jgi:hypothetical protein
MAKASTGLTVEKILRPAHQQSALFLSAKKAVFARTACANSYIFYSILNFGRPCLRLVQWLNN